MSPEYLTYQEGMHRNEITGLVATQVAAVRTEMDKEGRRRYGVIRKRLDKIDADISGLKDGHEGIHAEIAQIREKQDLLPVIDEKLGALAKQLEALTEQTEPVVEATKRFRRYQDTGHDVMWLLKTKPGKWAMGIVGAWWGAKLAAYFGGQPLQTWMHNEMMRVFGR